MSRTLTASDRKVLIRLASTLPKGSEERRAILAGLASPVSKKASRNIILPIPIEYDSGLGADELFGLDDEDVPGSTVEQILRYLGVQNVPQLKFFGGEGSVIESREIANQIFKKGKVLGEVSGYNGEVEAVAGSIGNVNVVMVDDYYPLFYAK